MTHVEQPHQIGTLLAHALYYAAVGWRVFPLHGVRDGACTCGAAQCRSPAKHPRVADWGGVATTDENQIRTWWSWWPDSNVGVRTGGGLLVLDVDVKRGKVGLQSLASLEQRHGKLPPTYAVQTGSGGWHLYFHYPKSMLLRKSLGTVAKDIDVMAEGGYVVAPPSAYASDGVAGSYRFLSPQNLLQPVPPWLAEHASRVAETATRATHAPKKPYEAATAEILEAARARLRAHGPAIQGNGGDQHTFEVGAILLNDWALAMPEAWPLAQEWNATCQPPWDLHELEVKLQNGEAYAKGEYGRERDALDLQRAMRTVSLQAGTRAFRDHVGQRSQTDLARGYTEADVAFFARDQGCDPKEFTKRWIIQYGTSFWLWVHGRYVGPVVQAAALGACKQYLAPANLDFWHREGKKVRSKTLNELVDDYGSVALHAEAFLDMQRSHYDAATGKFSEAVCPIREILYPEFNCQMDTWLRMVGGDDAEDFLDWVATVTELSLPTCALYIKAHKGIGKQLLSDGLSRLWTTGGPTELSRFIGNFNASVVRCPLIHADEKLPKLPGQNQGLSGEMRSFIASSTRTLNRKHIPEIGMRGCVRLLLTGNNEYMLEDRNEHDVTEADLQAIAERYLYIDAAARSDEIRAYLESLGGRQETDKWVKGDGLARHVLWLRENRPVRRGARFLVEGRRTPMHDALGSGYGLSAELNQWLVGYLANPAKAHAQIGLGVLVGNGKFLVSSSAVYEHWTTYVRHEASSLSVTAVGRQLRNISLGKRQIRRSAGTRHRYYEVDVAKLFAFALREDAGDVDAMRARVAAPDPSWTWSD